MEMIISYIVEEIEEEYNKALDDYTYVNRYKAAYDSAYNLALGRAYNLISGPLQRISDIKAIHHAQAKILMELVGIKKED